jgi:hypothetical protein
MQLRTTAKFISATILSSAIAAALGVGPLYAAQDANEVAIVENVSGHVIAFLAGKPALLEALDVVSDGTRLDLQANSELRICHYQTRQFLTLRGPLRASISREGVAVINGKTAAVAGESCAAPVSSTFSGGTVFRGVTPIPVSNVSGKR